MAEKVLSQDEVDALIRGVDVGAVETKTEEVSDTGLRSYDLTSQERFIRGRMPILDIINERFARYFQISLSATLRKVVEFSPSSFKVIKFGDFIKQIPLPSNINIIKMDPLRGHNLIVFDAGLVYLLVDHLFGGVGQTHVKTEGRDFTPIQMRFTRKIVDIMLEDLEKAWFAVQPLKISFVRAEANPQFATVVGPSEVVIAITFKLEIEEEVRDIFLCLPYPTIEPVREKLYGGFQGESESSETWGAQLGAQFGDCNVSVSADLGSALLSIEEIRDLRVGDVITLNQGAEEELYLGVEGTVKFSGRIGVYHGNLAFQITSLVKEKPHGG